VVQAVLAALAGLCGAGVAVRITPAWSEPLVLWQAVVGEPSSGKSSALASMRRLLGSIEAERRVHDDVRQEVHAEHAKQAGSCDASVRSQVVADDMALEHRAFNRAHIRRL
jgi:dephospho-CoA kinase